MQVFCQLTLSWCTCDYIPFFRNLQSINSSLLFRLILLNKLLEDGNMLFRQGQLADAAHRYRYALKRVPQHEDEDLSAQFAQIQLHLLLNLSRCQRR